MICYQARWVVPLCAPPLENGRVSVLNGRIESVERAGVPRAADVDLGDVVLLPAFVNAHTHLELSLLGGQVPFRGTFTQWLMDLMAARAGTRQDAAEAHAEGLNQSLASGVGAVADIGHGPEAIRFWSGAGLHVAGFLEVLGIGPRLFQTHARSLEAAIELAAGAAETAGASPSKAPFLRRIGFSPHAPYSTDPRLYQQVIERCRESGRHICTHLAETREEAQLLLDGTGPLHDLLERLGLWDGSFVPPGCSPVAWAEQIGLLACRPLLAHVNYLDDADMDRLARSGTSVVFCPRAHHFFGHEPHGYRTMLARGINVCLGTDSLACNSSLSILDEMRFLRRQDNRLADEAILEMGTLAGARGLGWGEELGALTPGRRALLVSVPLSNPSTSEPLRDVLRGDALPVRIT